jgi:tetratricopeptide (TPR) repeat protein
VSPARALPGRLVLALLTIAAAACDGPDGPAIPAPDLGTVEPLVARRIEQAVQAVEAAPGDAETWGRLGEIFDVHDLTPEAVVCYDEAARLDPTEWRWPYFAGVLLRTSDLAGALERLERAAELSPDYAPLLFYLGFCRYSAEDLDGAETAFRRALALEPSTVNATIGLARVALSRGAAAGFREPLERAVRLHPAEPALHAQLAALYRALGEDELAAREERAAGPRARRSQPGGMAPLEDPVREELFLRVGASLEWLRAATRHRLARGTGAEALAAWDEALALDPDSVRHLVESARLLTRLDRPTEATARLDRAEALAPDDPSVAFARGDLLAAAGSRREAAAAYRRALELDPELHDARTRLARLLLEGGSVDEGLRLLEQAVAARPDDPDARYNLAQALLWSGRPEPAERAAVEALELQPDHRETRFLFRDLARVLWRERRYAEALRCYRRAAEGPTEYLPLSTDLVFALATCPDGALRDGEAARTLGEELLERHGGSDPQLLDALAAARAETGDFAGALDSLDRALALVRRAVDEAPPARRQRLDLVLRQLDARRSLYAAGRPFHGR